MVPTQYCDIVVVGGSVAATRAAEAIARHAPGLTVTVVSDEPNAPYERPPLSKVELGQPMGVETLTYPAVATLQAHGVTFALGCAAQSLDTEAREIRTATGSFEYGALVIATGCEAIVPPLFDELPDVYTLRRFEDAVALRAAVADPDRSVAIVGAGFIGGEFATILTKQGRGVALIDLAAKPLGRFGDEVAAAYRNLHSQAGVAMHFGRAVVDVATDHRGRRAVVLDDGAHVPADVILLGIGVRPSTGWLENSGVTLVGGGIDCDRTLRATDGVFAAGDAVRWPNDRFGAHMRIEHWTNAAEQGRIAGLNAANTLLGQPLSTCSTVPYFWSDQHGQRIQFAGYRTGNEDVIIDERADGSLFLYRSDGEVTAVLAFERRTQFVKLRAALRHPLPWAIAADIAGLSVRCASPHRTNSA